MADRKLRVIPKSEADKRAVLTRTGHTKILGNEGGEYDYRFLCGQCDAVLGEIASGYSFETAVLLCNDCGSYNLIE